ncbi:MAG: sigma-70 family RNA polymerase sigma factor [Bifidobacteriaceae bacterium]|jgi:RNA polymerase sigma-70 factor (ECF subfamily)|nr:sigma-70 family RNA polymerase sigma factor [Bifidobacteriaceae bacterium]
MFAQHADTVYRYCRLRMEATDAHDAVSEVFVIALRKVGLIPEAQVAWLLGVARRVVANMLRGQRRSGALVARLGSEAGKSVPDVAESVMATDAAYRALAQLRAADREVLLLALSGPLTQSELGLALGCSSKAAGVRLTRARARLDQAVTELETAASPPPIRAPVPMGARHE